MVSPTRSASEHLARLFGVRQREDLIRLALDAYRETLAILGPTAVTVMTALVFPLVDADVLSPQAPHSDDILEEAGDEPPSIALIHRDALKEVHRFEEYRAPASIPQLRDLPEAYCFYRIFRDQEAMAREWEFGRCIVVYHVGGTPK